MPPLEAELEACREGIGLILSLYNEPCLVEMDCAEAVSRIKVAGIDRSANTFVIQERKRLVHSRHNIHLVAIHRYENNVSHTLSNFGRI
jgi:hypothetical protein